MVSRFEILDVLGAGADGVVVRAIDRADAEATPVALKVLRDVPTGPPLAGLRAEARILAWLCHPGIVAVHRLLEVEGRPVVVMEAVDGVSAMDVINVRRSGLPPPIALEIAARTAEALAAAWGDAGPDGRPLRIVHRDVKPANLLLSVDGRLKVADFGIAAAGRVAGNHRKTKGFGAPERDRNAPLDPAGDVYSLGVTLYGLLTARLLIAGLEGHDAAVASATDYLPDPAIGALIRRMCDLRPARRPAMAELPWILSALGTNDLFAWAQAEVRPLRDARRGDPHRHPAWSEVAFLEEHRPVVDLGLSVRGTPRALALRAVNGPREIEPLLRRIERRPWWSRWWSRPAPEELVAALEALRGSRDPRATSRAGELTAHPDPRVAEAAWELLAAAC